VTTTRRRFDIVCVVERLRASASPIGRVIPMVGLDDVVQILRYVQREFLVVVHVDHGSLAERPVQRHTHRAVHVLAAAWPHVVLVFVFFILVSHHDAHVYLVGSLVDDDLAGALRLAEAERDPKLELGDIALAEPKRTAETLWVSDRAWRRPLRAPLAVGLRVKFDDRLTRLVGCPPLPTRQPPLRILR
jgi:hypothetical protein